MSTHHMTVSTVERLALARSEPERRALVRAFARAGRERLLALGLASAVGVQLGFSRAHLAPFLGATPQTIGRLASRRLDPAAERALRLRFGLEERVQRRGRPAA